MTAGPPFVAPQYALPSCEIRLVHGVEEATFLSDLLAAMDPWRTLRYPASALARYLLRCDATLYRYAVLVHNQRKGVVCLRYPWLRGACLELIGLAVDVQRGGVGREILQWIEEQARREAPNVWVLVSTFNIRARAFYARQGFHEIGTLKDFVRPGYDEVLLRKVVR